jgi:hypothetical protein
MISRCLAVTNSWSWRENLRSFLTSAATSGCSRKYSSNQASCDSTCRSLKSCAWNMRSARIESWPAPRNMSHNSR